MTISEQVRRAFQQLPPGEILASIDLHRLSEDGKSVDKAVSRIHKKEGLQKLRNSLYYKPRESRYFGWVPPSAHTVIKALRKQYRARIVPSGALAAYELGFTAEPPEKRIYDTDKRIGTVELDNDDLHFRSVVAKKLRAASFDVTLLLNALEFFLKERPHLTYYQTRFVRRQLDRHSLSQVRRGLSVRPQWLRNRIESITQANTHIPYITGVSALNIPYRGRVGDWHQMGMLASNKFQIAGNNYYSAPGLSEQELFDCSDFLKAQELDLNTSLCARPERAIKDILYTNIIVKDRYPAFFMKDQFLLSVTDEVLRAGVDELRPLANSKQLKFLDQWLIDNDIH